MPKTIKNGTYVINLDEYADVRTHWIALYNSNIEMIYFDRFGVGHVPKGIKKFIGHKKQFNNVGHLCIGFIDFMLAGNSN